MFILRITDSCEAEAKRALCYTMKICVETYSEKGNMLATAVLHKQSGAYISQSWEKLRAEHVCTGTLEVSHVRCSRLFP